MPAHTVNKDAVRHAKRLIDARQYVLRSRWQDVQPRPREQNAFLKTHSWEEYAKGHGPPDPCSFPPANHSYSGERRKGP